MPSQGRCCRHERIFGHATARCGAGSDGLRDARDGALVEKRTGALLTVPDRVCPHGNRRYPEYRSPINGALIGSRSQQREDLNATTAAGRAAQGPRLPQPHSPASAG